MKPEKNKKIKKVPVNKKPKGLYTAPGLDDNSTTEKIVGEVSEEKVTAKFEKGKE